MKTVTGFLWSDIETLIKISVRQKLVLAEAISFGLGNGFTVPVRLQGEYQGTCSFGAPSLDRLQDNALPVAQICGSFAFKAARRIMKRRFKSAIELAPILTPRQHEAVILVDRENTDEEIRS